MSTPFNLETGLLIALGSFLFGAGGFYMLGLFNSKKLDKISEDMTCIKNDINFIKIEQAKTDQRLLNIERQNEKHYK